MSYDDWKKIIDVQNRMFDEAIKRQARLLDDAIRVYSERNSRMFEEAMKQYNQNYSRMFEDTIKHQLQIFNDSLKQQGRIVDDAIKQFSGGATRMLSGKTKRAGNTGGQNVKKKRKR